MKDKQFVEFNTTAPLLSFTSEPFQMKNQEKLFTTEAIVKILLQCCILLYSIV